jgi:alpha-tubulin suppressor-like RCC1 family protein
MPTPRGDGSTVSVPWLADDELVVWGSGRDGQLGLGADRLQVPTPVKVPVTWALPHQPDAQGPPPIVQVDCGYRHTALVSAASVNTPQASALIKPS